jgi:hypothetical protein
MPRARFIGPSSSLDHGTLRTTAARRIAGHHRLSLARHPLGRFAAMIQTAIRTSRSRMIATRRFIISMARSRPEA